MIFSGAIMLINISKKPDLTFASIHHTGVRNREVSRRIIFSTIFAF